ncbi:MAG: single-stranded DNA-binding protein [Chlamydiia bacterium]|nr:single-stranded DNA-binding protein [Chlamydiia bacterium]
MNFIHIAGHLGADPEVRFTSSGKKVTTLRVASRTRVKGNDETIWWRVTIWDDRFDKMIPHLKKGSAVIVVGELHKPEIFNDREGKPQISLEITASHLQFSPFGGKPADKSHAPTTTASASSDHAPANPYMSGMPSAGKMGETIDDEVPF